MIPAADGQQSFQLGIFGFKIVNSSVHLFVVPFVHGHFVGGLVDFGEGVHDMRTEEGVDIFGKELASYGSVLGPVGVVAHAVVAIAAHASCKHQRDQQQSSRDFHSDLRHTSVCRRLLQRNRI